MVKSRRQLAAEIGVSDRTLRARMKKAEMIDIGNLLSPQEQAQVYALFGLSYPLDSGISKHDSINKTTDD